MAHSLDPPSIATLLSQNKTKTNEQTNKQINQTNQLSNEQTCEQTNRIILSRIVQNLVTMLERQEVQVPRSWYMRSVICGTEDPKLTYMHTSCQHLSIVPFLFFVLVCTSRLCMPQGTSIMGINTFILPTHRASISHSDSELL